MSKIKPPSIYWVGWFFPTLISAFCDLIYLCNDECNSIIKMYYQDMVRELAQLLQNGGVSCISFNGLGLSRFYDHYSRLYFEICGHLYNHYYSSPHHERYCEKGVSNNIDSWTHYFVDIRAYFVFRRNISENCFWIFIGISFSHSKIFKDDWT